jgi:hypothetical protein
MIVAIKVILLMLTGDDDDDHEDYKTNKNYVTILVLIRYGFFQLTYQFNSEGSPILFFFYFLCFGLLPQPPEDVGEMKTLLMNRKEMKALFLLLTVLN